jgi:hypothetical protein
MGMEKGGQEEFEFPGAFWTTEDGKGALATEDADSITLFDASPLGSELSSLPPLDLTHLPLSSLDMSFLDSAMGTISAAGSSSQPFSSGQLDSALEDYTETWRKLVHESSMLASSFFQHDQPHPEFTFDTDPTPPLAFDFDVPAVPANSSEAAEAADQQFPATSSVEVVAPKPIRLANPAIHLAALVEDPDESAASVNQGDGGDDAKESDVQEGTFDPTLQIYGYSMEQLREYMSDSESSCDSPPFNLPIPPIITYPTHYPRIPATLSHHLRSRHWSLQHRRFPPSSLQSLRSHGPPSCEKQCESDGLRGTDIHTVILSRAISGIQAFPIFTIDRQGGTRRCIPSP